MFLPKAFYWGQRGARDNYALQIRNIVESGYRSLGEKPVIIGECGVPMDLNKGEAFFTDDFVWQGRMMDAMITALERALVGFTLWNYNPENHDTRGDDWNGENFSWFSQGRALPPSILDYRQTSPTLDNGARILQSVVRPYPAKTAGIPIKFDYEMTEERFVYEWKNPLTKAEDAKDEVASPTASNPPLSNHPELKSLETEIFLPHMLTQGRKIVVQGLDKEDKYAYDEERQTLFIVAKDTTPGRLHRVEVVVVPPLRRPPFYVNSFRSDWGALLTTVAVVFLAFIIALVAAFAM